jgi:hypothetical protein
MKKFGLLILAMLIATVSVANTRAWKPARVINVSETDVSGELRGNTNTVHYTIETADMIYFANYAYKPDHHSKNHPPEVAINVETKVAIEGKHAYLLDTAGAEVKLHIVKKTKK